MKSVFIEERNLDTMWFSLLSEVYKHGRKNHIDAGSFAGANRLEFDFVAGTIKFPAERPLAPIVPEGVPVPTTDEDIEKYFVKYIMNAELEANEHYKYATWISGGKYHLPKVNAFDTFGVSDKGEYKAYSCVNLTMHVPNQVEWVIKHYKEKGFGNNHCCIQVGYPESSFAYDIPFETEAERQTSPCLRLIDTHIKNDILHMTVFFRSWDLYAGFPENMGGITMLGEYMANELGIKMGPLSFSCLKLHCYDFQIEAVKSRLGI